MFSQKRKIFNVILKIFGVISVIGAIIVAVYSVIQLSNDISDITALEAITSVNGIDVTEIKNAVITYMILIISASLCCIVGGIFSFIQKNKVITIVFSIISCLLTFISESFYYATDTNPVDIVPALITFSVIMILLSIFSASKNKAESKIKTIC
ncbi:MAG: hypothetical protein UH239_08940 [Acutalibacteraceae bacterium]|nr:hypothetical protein [Acutalibacteraceae bacterium]